MLFQVGKDHLLALACLQVFDDDIQAMPGSHRTWDHRGDTW